MNGKLARRLASAIAIVILLFAAGAVAQTSSTTPTTSGSFSLTDQDNIFGQGPSISLDATNAKYAATATMDTVVPTQVDAFQFGASPTGAGAVWTFAFNNGGAAVQQGTFNIDGSVVTAALSYVAGTQSQTCEAAFGTVSISTLTTNPQATTTSVFTNLQGTFNITCANVPSSLLGSFGFTSTTVTPPTPPTPPSPPSGGGGILIPQFPTPRGPVTPPTSPPTPPAPTLTVSGPVLTQLVPIELMSGASTTLQFTTVVNSTFNAAVTMSATSDNPGLTFTFNPATIPAPGDGTTSLTLSAAGAPQNSFNVTVTATGGGLTASTTFPVIVFCDPPFILAINEPASASVASGSTPALTVTPTGSGPFTYQWYQGYHGFTNSPIAGANAATFTTPPLTATTQYWVRITNACGTADSSTATLTVTP